MLSVASLLLLCLAVVPQTSAAPRSQIAPTAMPAAGEPQGTASPQPSVKPIGLATICALIAVIGASSFALVAGLAIQKRMLAIAEELEQQRRTTRSKR